MDLTDQQWEVLEPLIPEPPGKAEAAPGGTRGRSSTASCGSYALATPWRDLPDRYPPCQTCHRRFQRWIEEGVLSGILEILAEDLEEHGGLDLSECFIDGTFVVAKKGTIGRKDQAGQRYEAHGGCRRLWCFYLCARGECSSARGHPC